MNVLVKVKVKAEIEVVIASSKVES